MGGSMDDLHLRIRRWRQVAGLSRIAFAAKVGVSPASITYWEAEDGHGPSTDRLPAIAGACGVTLSVFFSHIPPAPETDTPLPKPAEG